LRGRHGVLLTGHALAVADVSGGGAPAVVHRGADTSDTTVHFGAPSDADLDVYLRTGEPLECAGAFTIESLGGWFIDRIDGDPSSVIGLSLPLLRRLLSDAGLHAHDVWRRELLGRSAGQRARAGADPPLGAPRVTPIPHMRVASHYTAKGYRCPYRAAAPTRRPSPGGPECPVMPALTSPRSSSPTAARSRSG